MLDFDTYSRFPFDWKNPLGYLIAITIEYIMFIFVFLYGGGEVCFGIGSFLFSVAASTDIKADLKEIGMHGVLPENRKWTLYKLSNFIQVHAQLKQLSCITILQLIYFHILLSVAFAFGFFFFVPRLIDDFNNIYQHKFLILTVWSLGKQ